MEKSTGPSRVEELLAHKSLAPELPPPLQPKASAPDLKPTTTAQATPPQVPLKKPMPPRKPTHPQQAVMLPAALALLILYGLGFWFVIHQNNPQTQPSPMLTPEPTPILDPPENFH